MRVNGVQLRVRGKVQGVGFRPFVWQLAHQMMLTGDVCNDGEGVLVRLAGNGGDFTARLRQDCPPLARIDDVDTQPFSWSALPTDFTIRQSESGAMDTQIVPDAATCPACLAEMRDPRSAVIVTRLSTVPIAARASPSSAPCPTIARPRQWPTSRCAHRVKPSIATRPIGVFTLSRWPARTAGQR